METNITPYKFPCKNVTHDGYPNLSTEEQSKVTAKNLAWFKRFLNQCIYVNSPALNGMLVVSDNEHAKLLVESQKHGFSFISLNERMRHALDFDDQTLICEPVLNHFYKFNYYVNGELKETKRVLFKGFTDNKKFYIFIYSDGPDQDGFKKHLLPVGNFPTFIKRVSPDAIVFEQYSQTNETTKS